MSRRDELIRKLRRDDMIRALRAKDQRDQEAEATYAAEAKYEAEKPGYLESAARGLYQGATRDWGDEISAGLRTAIQGGDYEENRRDIRRDFERARQANPKTYGASEFGGAFATAIPAGGSARSIAGRAVGGGLAGAAEGGIKALGTADELDAGAFQDAAMQSAVAGGFGSAANVAAPYVGRAVGAMTKPIYEGMRNFAGTQATKALKGNLGQIERAGENVPEIGKMYLDEGVVGPFTTQKGMYKRSQDLSEAIQKQKVPIYEQSSRQSMTREDISQQMADMMNANRANPETIGKNAELGRWQDRVMESDREYFNPSDVGRMRKRIGKKTKFDSDVDAQEAKQDLYFKLRENEMDMIRRQDPRLMQQNEDLFRKDFLNIHGQGMAKKGADRGTTNNAIALTSYLAAAGFAKPAAEAMQAMGGPALAVYGPLAAMGTREILRRYGNQWTATGANRLAKTIASPKYAGAFEAALNRGGNAVATLHEMLLRKDPVYSQEFQSAMMANEGADQ